MPSWNYCCCEEVVASPKKFPESFPEASSKWQPRQLPSHWRPTKRPSKNKLLQQELQTKTTWIKAFAQHASSSAYQGQPRYVILSKSGCVTWLLANLAKLVRKSWTCWMNVMQEGFCGSRWECATERRPQSTSVCELNVLREPRPIARLRRQRIRRSGRNGPRLMQIPESLGGWKLSST